MHSILFIPLLLCLTPASLSQLITYQSCSTSADCLHPRLSHCATNQCQPCADSTQCTQFGTGSQCLSDGTGAYCTLPCNSANAPDICAPINALCINLGGYICNGCQTAANCEAQYPIGVQCYTIDSIGYCGFCLSDDQCPSQHTCRNFRCTECLSNSDCPAERPVCDIGLKTYTCKCLTDNDCPASRPSCTLATNKDVNACYVLPTMTLEQGERPEIIYLVYNKDMAMSKTIEEIFEVQITNTNSNFYSYELTALSSTKYQLVFTVNTNIYNPILQIDILEPTEFLDLDYLDLTQTTYTMNLGTLYLLPEAQEKAANSFATMATVLVILIISLSVLAIFLKRDSVIIWMTLNMLQASYYLLFIEVEYPLNTQLFLRRLSITTFKSLPNVIAFMSDTLQTDLDNSPHGYGQDGISDLFLLGMSYLILLWLIIAVFLGLVIAALKFISLPKQIQALFFKIRSYSIWAGVLRLALACYNEFAFISFLQAMNLDFDSGFGGLSSILGITASVISIVMPFLFIPLLKRNVGFTARDKSRFGLLVNEYNYEIKIGRFYLTISLTRQLIVALFIIFCSSSPLTTCLILIALDLCSMTILGLKPFKQQIHNMLHSAHEILSLFTHFLVLSLVLDEYGGQPEGEIRIWTAWGIIGSMTSLLFICVGAVILEIGKSVKALVDKSRKHDTAKSINESLTKKGISMAYFPRGSSTESQKISKQTSIEHGVGRAPGFDDVLSSSYISNSSIELLRNRSGILTHQTHNSGNNNSILDDSTFGRGHLPFQPIENNQQDQEKRNHVYFFSLANIRKLASKRRKREDTPPGDALGEIAKQE